MSLADRSLVVIALLSLGVPATAHVIVVDKSGAGNFTSLPAAVAAAADGDTLLVRPGDYRVFQTKITISSKSLVIAADGTGAVLSSPFEINQGATTKRIVMRGLTIEAGTFDPATTGLAVSGGDALFEGCTLLGRDGNPAFANAFGGSAVVTTSGHIVFKDCTIEGGRGSDASSAAFVGAQPGGVGLNVLGAATVDVYGGSVKGGDAGNFVPGGFTLIGPGSGGGSALVADFDATLFVAGCTLTGGHGGNGNEVPGNFSGGLYAGGDAIDIFNQTHLSLLDSTLVGGAPGVDGAGTPGPAGDALQTGSISVVVQLGGTYRSTGFGAPTGEGSTLAFNYDGVAGDLVGMFVALSPASLQLPGKQGVFQLGAPLLGPFVLGPVGPTGSLALGFAVPNVGFGPDDSLLLYEQAFVKPLAGATLLSCPSTALLLDDSF